MKSGRQGGSTVSSTIACRKLKSKGGEGERLRLVHNTKEGGKDTCFLLGKRTKYILIQSFTTPLDTISHLDTWPYLTQF